MGHDLAQGGEAVQPGHLYVQGDDVGLNLGDHVQRFTPIVSHTRYRQAGGFVQIFADGEAHVG